VPHDTSYVAIASSVHAIVNGVQIDERRWDAVPLDADRPEIVALDRAESLAERAYRALREQIATGGLAPGERVTERALALRLGVSPTPVREALRRLEQERLIERVGPRQLRIAEQSEQALRELLYASAVVRAAIARFATAKITDQALDEMADLVDRLERDIPLGDPQHQLALAGEFDDHLVAAADNDVLAGLLDTASVFSWSARVRAVRAMHERDHEVGFPAETVAHGIAHGAEAIVVDGGSTDSGPYYLGTATAKTNAAAVRHDLDILLTAARAADIPLIVSSCGTSGTDAGVDWVSDMVVSIAQRHRLSFTLARIYSEQDAATLVSAMDAGKITALAPAPPITAETIRSCAHIVGVLGSEPIADAVRAGAQVVLTGRATDTAPLAALASLRGIAPGPAWHAAKTTECGGLCTTNPLAGVLVDVDDAGFVIESLDPASAATPTSVAAHMIYENADPFRMREPSGTLDTSQARYLALDERRVRVEGSRFEPAGQYTVKLEGSAHTGYETISLVGIRDPHVLSDLATWAATLETAIAHRAESVLGLTPHDYRVALLRYGDNAILGDLEPERGQPREVAVVLKVRAGSQELATNVAKVANPLLLHLPLPGMDHLPSFAFLTSPAEIERGAAYEFALHHAVDVDSPEELFRIKHSEVTHA
jgi:DNA-binding GntR family transcriptional regulator